MDAVEAAEHLPDGSTLVLHQVSWDEYERLLEQLSHRPRLRISYDRGKLEIMTPLPEHETYARFIDDLVGALADHRDLPLEKFGGATWKRRQLARGVEPDSCYYVQNAERVIGIKNPDLDSDPPPDLVVEIDITNESLGKFPMYAALQVPEIWRYDGDVLEFYERIGDTYERISESRAFPGLIPTMITTAIERIPVVGQRQAVREFRKSLDSPAV